LSIQYALQASHPEAHEFTVQMHISEPNPNGQTVRLPTWIPGSYMIRDFSKNLVTIDAASNGQPVELEKVDKSTWKAPAGLSDLTLHYVVYAWDLSVRTAHLDANHGFFNGTSVFLSADGFENTAHTVTIEANESDSCMGWQVATSLKAIQINADGFGVYEATDYDDLIDHPVEMGRFERVSFTACGLEHELVLTGRFHTDIDRIVKDLTKICEYQIKFFGEPSPVKDKYVFLVMVVGEGYGGLEHRASTALLVTRDDLPVPGDEELSENYVQFLGLCSHEYFHTWNVKRIKPAVFVPFELQAESYTELLWFFEGMTSYYDDLLLVRAGLIPTDTYLTLLGRIVTRVQRGAGRLVQSVTESSFDAWNKFYKQDENAPNAIVSYYAKGALVAVCLDAALRSATNGEKSLDDVMQTLWQNWLATGGAGIDEQEPQRIASEIAGTDLTAFFDKALYSTEELPLQEALAELGVQLDYRARSGASDRGGETAKTALPAWVGANLQAAPGGVKITHVFNEGAALAAGLAAGDTVVALDYTSVSATSFANDLNRHQAEEVVTVHYFRLGELHVASLPIMQPVNDTAVLTVSEPDKFSAWVKRREAASGAA